MKISYQWLNELVVTELSAKQLSEQLTLAGLEVDSIEPAALDFSGVIVGEVVQKEKHPDADKLSLTKVNTGNETLDIVCGASNVKEGMKVAVARVGAKLPGDFKIKKSKIRGQVSLGMLCSESELGLSESSHGIMALDDDAPIGKDIREYLKLDDVTIEVDLTPNRADCLSLEGIAREVAALNQTTYQAVDVKPVASSISNNIPIEIKDKDFCPRYISRSIEGVNPTKKTPLWISEKLRRCGIRPISIIVDITNYVMLELGQPMHAFDLDKINGGIVVRKAKKQESITLLDDSEIRLDETCFVIADHKKPLALAGIMGGVESAVSDKSVNIFLESAYFNPEMIAGKARKFGLHTDSSHRFERGVDPNLAQRAIERATDLIISYASGKPSDINVAENAQFLPERLPIKLHLEKIKRLLGLIVKSDEVVGYLTGLGFKLKEISKDSWEVSVPSWRFDVAIEEDLIEEVARLYGYENLPQSLPSLIMPLVGISEEKLNFQKIKDLLISRSYREAITYSFIDPKFDQYFAMHKESLRLKNPISSDMAVMRQSLLPGLLSSLTNNIHRQQNRVRLFELGNAFIYDQTGNLNQTMMLAGVAIGDTTETQWSEQRQANFYDLKSDLMAVLGLTNLEFAFKIADDIAYLHPGRSAYLVNKEEIIIGVIGELHPNAQKLMSLKGKAPIVFEVNLDKLNKAQRPRFKSWSKYPSISRDLAIVVDKNIPVGEINEFILKQDKDILIDVSVFDLYQGDSLPKNKKSVAFNLILQDSSKTLKDDDINQVVLKIMTKLEETYQATLRE
ncbi:phenylalanine--tRNA ligase subunit beta [Thiotrichales bacterium 19S9-12]|nr:phenylalanine--tRNA ligase subunit beta [Thiotrichales bacterium 19S9-11]MCF6811173.1 phenylalanine--tRNA ligase subunit beta [Thiotrichales bacterium 19S9-12]